MPLTTEAEQARMAESVDALVSNTSGAIRAGSIPAPGTRNPRRVLSTRVFLFSFPTWAMLCRNFAGYRERFRYVFALGRVLFEKL